MFVLYIVAYLDRVNVGFAKLQMQQELGFSDTVFGIGMGIFFVGYFLLEIPSNLIMERVGARRWIARIMITWGILAIAMMFAHSVWMFYTLRLLLGMAEAGFFPGMILYLTYWFPAAERGRAVGRFMTATAVANIIGSPVSGALLKMHGWNGLSGWQWLFLLEGIPACILGLVVLWYLPDGPKDARWLNPKERDWVLARLAPEHAAGGHKHDTLGQALTSPKVWLLCAIYFCQATGSYGFGFWLPTIIKDTFHMTDDLKVGLLNAIPYIFATIGLLVVGAHSDRTGERRMHVVIPSFWAAGCLSVAAFLLMPGSTPLPAGTAAGLAFAVLALAPFGMAGTLGPFWDLPTAMLSGAAAAGGIALINSVGNLGGFLGGYALGALKQQGAGFTGGLFFVAGAYALLGILTLGIKTRRVVETPTAELMAEPT